MLHQVQAAVTPDIPLRLVLGNWVEIREKLAENGRSRQPQLTFC